MPIVIATNYDPTNSEDECLINSDNVFAAVKDRSTPDYPTLLISPDGSTSRIKESVRELKALFDAEASK